jgi:two-component system alkaline phosphatase synthesis response regulator PhoP
MPHRVLIVHNEASFTENLRHNLELDGYEVAIEHDAQWGVIQARTFAPELVIADLDIIQAGKGRMLSQLESEHERLPILVLSSRSEDAGMLRGFRLGIDDFVMRPVGVGEMHARIDRLLGRRQESRPEFPAIEAPIAFGKVLVRMGARTITRDGRPIELRLKEFELLMALITREGRVATRMELLGQVWGYRTGVTSRTLDSHIAELRRKLEENPTSPRYIITVRKIGYRFDRIADFASDLRERPAYAQGMPESRIAI